MDTAQSTPQARTRVKLPHDPYGDEPGPRRGRRPLVLGGALLALLLTVTLVNRGGHGSAAGRTADNTDANTPATTGGAAQTVPFQASGLPAGSADQVPITYPDTAQGAESAAANYVVAYTASSMVQPAARHRLINAIADPAIASSLQSQLDATYATTNGYYGLAADGAPPAGLTFVQRSAPVGVTLVNHDGGGATVSVWVVTVAGLAGQGSTHPVTEGWSTVTVTLHWTSGDWKWVSFTSVDGPAPVGGQQTPASSQALQSAINQFGGLRYAR